MQNQTYILTVVPYVVVTNSLKVIGTAVGIALALAVGVVDFCGVGTGAVPDGALPARKLSVCCG